MGRPISVLALGLDTRVRETVREELDDGGILLAESSEIEAAALGRCGVVLLDDSGSQAAWRDRLQMVHRARPELAIVLLTSDPASLWVTGALRNRRLFQAVGIDLRPGELFAACLAAHEVTALRYEAAEQRRIAQRRVEVMATLHELSAAVTELGSYAEVLEHVTRDLHRLVRFELAAVLAAVDGSAAVLHLHCQDACDVTLVRAVRDKCLESFRAAAGRSIDESELIMNLSGRPVLTAGPLSRPPVTTQIPLVSAGDTIGLLFLSSSESAPLSNEERRLLYLLANRTADTLVRLKTRLGDERRRLTMMVESMADGLILTDTHSEKVLINPAARRLLGIEGTQPITQHFLKETLGFYPFDLVATEGGAATVREEVRIKDKVLHSMVSPVRDAGGKLDGVVVVLRDFTEARALARRQAEFVSAVSHELRSPLTSITGALDIVLSEYAGRLTEKQRRYAQLARESCTKLNQVVDDLLDVARSERGRMPVSLTPILLDELGRDSVERFRPAAQQKRVKLEAKTVGSAIRIMGDPDRLSQVLSNLLSNAIKFTPEGGLVEVEVFGPSVALTHVGVAVFNNGEPIPEEARERIFEKFERLDAGDRQVGGTGLGLAISRAIVEAHGGRIWVETRTDGTKFVFTLPAAPDAAETAEVGPAIDAASPPDVPGATVLLVHDDDYSGYILKGILMGAGHEVLVASNGEDALQIARTRRPSLVVLSAALADDPIALVRILKHDPDTRKSAAIMLSSSGEDRENLLRAGADEVVTVPIQPQQFRDLCARQLAEAGRDHAYRILVVDDDPSIRTICREVLETSGYAVREVGGGHQVRAEMHRFKPDLVMLDVMMPGMDGFQTAELLRSETQSSMVPIIFLSAKGETADKVRAFRLGAEDYVVKPFIAAELVARVRKALERRERELGASPTTQLPGAGAIEAEIERRLDSREPAAFCYLDLDNLKAFNDYYGYAKADGVIRQTADLLRDVLAQTGTSGDFIGHIAGDDFVFITRQDTVDAVCTTLCSAFDRLVPLYYNKADREKGFIETRDRFGVMRRFPIMSVSLVAVTVGGGGHPVASYSELAGIAAAGKKLAKSIEGSSYVRDGRPVVGDLPPALDGSEVVA